MLKTPYTNQRQESTVVAVDPTLQRMRSSRLLVLIAGVLGLAIICIGVIAPLLDKHSTFPTGYLIFMAIYFIAMSLYVTWMTRFWKRLEQRRQAAARGDPNLLAADQPRPDANALSVPTVIGQPSTRDQISSAPGPLSLPTTIRQRLSRTVVLFFGAAVLLAAVSAVVATLILSALLPPHVFLSLTAIIIIAVILLFLFVVLFGIILAVIYAKVRQQLTVTETGLIMPGFGQVHSVSWREARLFAIDGVVGAKRYPHPALFELSSASDVVRWTWLRRSNGKLIFFARPMLPEEEYNQQMRALLSLIAARTGLPLYDLRDKPAQ